MRGRERSERRQVWERGVRDERSERRGRGERSERREEWEKGEKSERGVRKGREERGVREGERREEWEERGVRDNEEDLVHCRKIFNCCSAVAFRNHFHWWSKTKLNIWTCCVWSISSSKLISELSNFNATLQWRRIFHLVNHFVLSSILWILSLLRWSKEAMKGNKEMWLKRSSFSEKKMTWHDFNSQLNLSSNRGCCEHLARGTVSYTLTHVSLSLWSSVLQSMTQKPMEDESRTQETCRWSKGTSYAQFFLLCQASIYSINAQGVQKIPIPINNVKIRATNVEEHVGCHWSWRVLSNTEFSEK